MDPLPSSSGSELHTPFRHNALRDNDDGGWERCSHIEEAVASAVKSEACQARSETCVVSVELSPNREHLVAHLFKPEAYTKKDWIQLHACCARRGGWHTDDWWFMGLGSGAVRSVATPACRMERSLQWTVRPTHLWLFVRKGERSDFVCRAWRVILSVSVQPISGQSG